MSTIQAFICDAVRTPIGRYGGALSTVRTDDLGAVPIAALMQRNPGVDWGAVDDVVYGCVKRVYSDIATLECTPQGLKLIDTVDGLTHAELEKLVGLPIAAA